MPNVKQVDFDLNAINNELTGADTDLHREMMTNLIQQNTYVFKVVNQTKQNIYVKVNSRPVLFVNAAGAGLIYQWQRRDIRSETWHNVGSGDPKTTHLTVLAIPTIADNEYRCRINDKFGNTMYSKPIIVHIK